MKRRLFEFLRDALGPYSGRLAWLLYRWMYPFTYELIGQHGETISSYIALRPRSPNTFAKARVDLPPVVTDIILVDLLCPGDHFLILTEGLLRTLAAWANTGIRQQQVHRDLRDRLLSLDRGTFRGAWAEACFYVWLLERGVPFDPAVSLPSTIGGAIPPNQTLPNPDARIQWNGQATWWDAKAYSLATFDETLYQIVDEYRRACREERPTFDALVSLALDVNRLGRQDKTEPRTLYAEEAAILAEVSRFRDWVREADRQSDWRDVAFSVPQYGKPVLTVRILPSPVPFQVGGVSAEEIAFQLRSKIAENARQLHTSDPNVCVIVKDSFSSHAMDEQAVWYTAHGYEYSSGSVEGILRLTGPQDFSRKVRLPNEELSKRIHAVVFFWPAQAFRAGQRRVFPDVDTRIMGAVSATMFLREDRLASPVAELGRTLGCDLRTQSEREETFIS